MSKFVGTWFDLVLLILVMIYTITMTSVVTTVCTKPVVQGLKDKSMLVSDAGIYMTEKEETMWDVIYMFATMDDFIPYPNVIQIGDTPEIVITEEWLANKSVYLNRMCNTASDWALLSIADCTVTREIFFKADGTAVLKFNVLTN